MAEIFVSYASEVREKVRALVQRLQEQGWMCDRLLVIARHRIKLGKS